VVEKLRHPSQALRSIKRRTRRRAGLPPTRPRGWVVGPPDFVGVGAQRSGTTWWYGLICQHPAIQQGPGKEKHFFDRFHGRDLREQDLREYQQLFPRPPGALTGEWTPRYMHDFWTPALLAQAAPQAKILVLLRDPWDRFRSGNAHECRVLHKLLRRDRSDYLKATIVGDALSRSLYSRQLQGVFEQFDREQVLVLQYERCREDPAEQLRRTYAFLGLERADYLPASITSPAPPSSWLPLESGDHWSSAQAALAHDATELQAVVPEIDLGLWPSLTADAPDLIGTTDR